MFDGHALLLVAVALILFAAALVAWRRADEDVDHTRRLPQTQPRKEIRVVCAECRTEICVVLTPLEAAVEDQLHHLVRHGGAR